MCQDDLMNGVHFIIYKVKSSNAAPLRHPKHPDEKASSVESNRFDERKNCNSIASSDEKSKLN